MKLVVAAGLIALAFTTGFTCSKNAPEAAAPAADAAAPAADAAAAPAADAAAAPAAETAPAAPAGSGH